VRTRTGSTRLQRLIAIAGRCAAASSAWTVHTIREHIAAEERWTST
jgi:hypothetical protein